MADELDLEETLQKLGAEIMSLREQIALKDKALEPFAEILKHKFTDPLDWNDDDGLAVQYDGKDISVGDLRRAAQALSPSLTDAK